MNPLVATGCILLLVVSISFFVAVVLAFCSKLHRRRFRKHPILHAVWGLVAVASLVVLVPPLFPYPSGWWIRHKQRQIVRQRVEEAGGYAAIRRACNELAARFPEGLEWEGSSAGTRSFLDERSGILNESVTNNSFYPLPSAMAKLEPRSVRYIAPDMDSPEDKRSAGFVRIQLFGRPSTAGRTISVLFYFLDVPAGPTNFPINLDSGFLHNKLADGVYEEY